MFVLCLLAHLFQKIGKAVMSVELLTINIDHTIGTAVRDYIIHRPVMGLQISDCFLILFIGRHLLFPPGKMVDSERRTVSPQKPILHLKFRIVQFQNASGYIMAGCTTHGKEAMPINVKYLAPHQMNHIRTDELHLASVPFHDWIFGQCFKVLMVARHK